VKPILYNSEETAFANNGIGILSDAVSCYVDAETNSIYELTVEYPVNGIHFTEICKNAIILARPGPDKDAQPFRVYRITKPLNGKVAIYARHIAYDLQGIPISPFKAANASEAMTAIGSNAVISCPFTFETDVATTGTMETEVPTDAWTLLGTSDGILSVYGGEYELDRFAVRLKTRLGADKGVVLRYGLNLTSLEQDDNCDSVYTGIYPFWAKDGTIVTLDEKILNASGTFNHAKILTVDLTEYFSEAPTQEKLRATAQSYMEVNGIGVPEISWTVGYVQLSKTVEYKDSHILEEINLGDTVTVSFPKMGIATTSRVVKTRYNVLLDRHESISIGKVKSTISETIAKETAQHKADVARLGGSISSTKAEMDTLGKDLYKEVSLKASITDLNSAISRVGTVEAGMSAFVKAMGYDPDSDSYDSITAFSEIGSTIGDSKAGLENVVTALGYDPETKKYSQVEAISTLKTKVGDAESGLVLQVTRLNNALGYSEENGEYKYDQIDAITTLGNTIGSVTDEAGETYEASTTLFQKASFLNDQAGALWESLIELTTTVGYVKAGLKLYAGIEDDVADADLGNSEKVTAAAELYTTDGEVKSIIGAYVVNSNGTTKTLAQILADVITLQGDVNVKGKLTVSGDYVWSDSPLYVNNNITGKRIVVTQDIWFPNIGSFAPTEITSTTGTVYTVLGAA